MAMTEKPTGFATLQLAMDAIRRHEEAKRRASSSCPVIKPISLIIEELLAAIELACSAYNASSAGAFSRPLNYQKKQEDIH